jgi:hypothetical protein
VLADLVGPQWAVGTSGFCLVIFIAILFRIPAYRDLD